MSKEIIIEVSTDAKVFDNDKSIIQYKGWEKVQKDLHRKLKYAENYSPSKNFTRVHETITIIGERGTGKSTFILNLHNRLRYQKIENLKQIHPLDILDPTLISTRQNILVNIITLIRKEVVESDGYKTKKHEDWVQSLKGLASGINQIENIGSDPYKDAIWDDPTFVLEKGLNDSQGGLNFEKSLHLYIQESLQILNKKMFALILDDIDTDFKKGWDVLEIIRKYITSPQLTTIVSGDMSLYTLLIRQKQWDLFEILQKNEKENYQEYKKEIDHLVEQYLIKVLHPENYINLYRLDYFLFYNQNNGLEMKIKEKEKEAIAAIDLFYKIVEDGFRIKRSRNSYVKLFTKLPIRSNMQIIKAYFDSLEDKKFNRKYFIQRVKDIFLSTFFKFKFDAQFIAQIRETHSIDSLLDKARNNKPLFKSIAMQQIDNVDEDMNIIVTLINGMYDTYFEDSLSKYIEWFIKIGLTNIIVFDELLYKDSKNEKEKYDDYKKYLQFDRYLSTDLRVLKIQGLVEKSGLFATSYRAKTSSHKIYFLDNINQSTRYLTEKIEVYTEVELLALLLLGSVKTGKSQMEDAFSLLYLLTFIEELFSYDHSDTTEFRRNIEGYFSKLLQENYRLTSSYKFKTEKEEDGDEEESIDIETNKIEISQEFIDNLIAWIKEKEAFNLPMSEFSLAGQEFAKKMHNSIKPFNEFFTIAEYINTSIYIFLNQVLYQNYRYEYGFDAITFREIKKSNSAYEIFTSNIAKLPDPTQVNLKFFNFLNKCPLWSYYQTNDSVTGSTYDELNKYLIHGGKMSPQRFLELYNALPTPPDTDDVTAIQNLIKETFNQNKKVRFANKRDCESILSQNNNEQ